MKESGSRKHDKEHTRINLGWSKRATLQVFFRRKFVGRQTRNWKETKPKASFVTFFVYNDSEPCVSFVPPPLYGWIRNY